MDRVTAVLAALLLAIGFVPLAVAQGPAAPDAPERLIVLFDAMPAGLQRQDRYKGAEVVSVDEAQGFAVVQASHGKAFRDEARASPEVRAVEIDGVVQGLGFIPNDPMFASPQYAPNLIGAPAAWSTTRGHPSAAICMLDTGVRPTHQDLAANYAGGIDLVNDDNDPRDDGGHGTRTAGAAVGAINNGKGIAGIANVPIKSVKVLSSTGSGYDSDIATGIRWCADNGARIVTMSLGGTGASATTSAAIDYAWGKGLLLVAGAGNGGCTDCVLYPAAFPKVIAVGSVDSNRAVSGFTSQGPQIDLAAPGVNIQTTGFSHDSHYLMGGGTSMSAPHVAGAAALVWSAHPEWTNLQVRTALEATAQDVGPYGRDTWSGTGLVRPDRAIAYGSAPPSAGYTASFTTNAASNEYWVQEKVVSSPAPAKVDIKVNGGAWQPLKLQSYGDWTGSLAIAKGTPVVFRATAPDGQTAQSASQSWLGAATITTSSTAFKATFTPKSVGSDWWVETAVSANQGVTKVEAKVGSGAWVVLDKQSWGNYAKSLNAPNGSQVTFRATSSTGALSYSGVTTWT